MLVKDPQKRVDQWVRQYEKKTKGRRKRKASPETVQKLKNEFTIGAHIENGIKKILGETAPPTIMNVSYHNYAREISALIRRYRGEELQNRMGQVTQKWLARTLDKTILDKIRQYVLTQFHIVI